MNRNDFRLSVPVVSCACLACKTMCMSSPCIGTPADMLRLAMAGYDKNLARTLVRDPVTESFEETICIKGESWTGPQNQVLSRCTMLTEDGMCSLHENGLKPTEGKVLTHGMPTQHNYGVRHRILTMWDSPMGRALLNAANANIADFDLRTVIE